MTETQERFLRAVAERLPLERVAEVHLFPSIRQGGVETGVAVIAVEAEPAGEGALDDEAPAERAEAGSEEAGAAAEPGALADVQAKVGQDDAGGAPVAVAAGEQLGSKSDTAADVADGTQGGRAADGAHDAGAPPQLQHTAPSAPRPHHFAASEIETPPAPRHTIFSARYRLTLKGPDRGRWEADVVAEADAPLATADLVVRGVRKRTGEATDAERVAPEVLRQLVAQPV